MRASKRKRCLSVEKMTNWNSGCPDDYHDQSFKSSLDGSASKKSKKDARKLSDISNFEFNLDIDQSHIVAAKKSSYFNLTPASSVTSLVDLNDDIVEPVKPRPKRQPAKKRTRKVQSTKKSLKEKENQSVCVKLQKTKVLIEDAAVPQSKKSLTEYQLLNDLNLFYKNYDQLQPKSTSVKSSPFPNLTWTDKFEFFECMRLSELKYHKNSNYLAKHKSIEPQMRAILIDWLIEISYAYRLHRETLHLAIEYLDRFMTMSQVEMRVDRLQLIGLTSLYLAAKNEEIYPPKLSDFASHMESYSSDNEDLMKKFEIAMLKTLEWNISPVTANTWLQTYIQLICANFKHYVLGNDFSEEEHTRGTELVIPVTFYKNSDKSSNMLDSEVNNFYLETFLKSVTLIDLCLFDMEGLHFDYSVVSASALYYVLKLRGLNQVNFVIEKVTGYKLEELDECIKWMLAYFEVCKELVFDQNLCQVKKFNSIEPSDWHNIQLYQQYLDLLKEAQSRKFKARYDYNVVSTPPDSVKRCSTTDSRNTSLSSAND